MRANRGRVKRGFPERTGGGEAARMGRPPQTERGPLNPAGPRPLCRDFPTKQDSSPSISVVVEGESVRLTQAVEDRFERGEDGRGETDDRAERYRDGAARPLRPVGHREAGDEP